MVCSTPDPRSDFCVAYTSPSTYDDKRDQNSQCYARQSLNESRSILQCVTLLSETLQSLSESLFLLLALLAGGQLGMSQTATMRRYNRHKYVQAAKRPNFDHVIMGNVTTVVSVRTGRKSPFFSRAAVILNGFKSRTSRILKESGEPLNTGLFV